MKRVAILFVLAVLVPSVVLALLASRTLRDQQFVLERQQTLLYQTVTDSFAKEINDFLAEQQRQFIAIVESLVTNAEPRATSAQFDDQLRAAWPLAEVGFAVTLNGMLLCPSPTARPETRSFCLDNGGFLANKESVEVYWNDYSAKNSYQNIQKNPSQQQAEIQQTANFDPTNSLSALNFSNLKTQSRKVNPAQQAIQTFAPNEAIGPEQNVSKVFSTEAEFHQLIGEATDGMLARFLQNKLRLMFWHRLERDPQLVFGAQLNLAQVKTMLQTLVEAKQENVIKGYDSYFNRRNSIVETAGVSPSGPGFPDEVCVVILDENTTPVAKSNPRAESSKDDLPDTQDGPNHAVLQATKNLKNPFVSTEIGEALPHWEVAAYLMNPDAIKKAALTARLTLGLLIALLLIAMVVGSFLIVNDLNRQVTLARQKTDFVSNVSHELKTPLTSIRMFAELLAEDRVAERDKQKSYLNIITSEAARLTRLINNVLDFSRLERGEKKYNLGELNLAALVNETVATYRPHLESNGFQLDYQSPTSPVTVRGDRDALAQVIVNLISNAEKYSNGSKEIVVELSSPSQAADHAAVRVLDRGPGVPRGLEEKIFEQFYRVPDSLSSGIQGSGLGLTLARQIARAHGGEVTYSPRDGGGSCFALRLPLTQPSATLSPSDGEREGVRG